MAPVAIYPLQWKLKAAVRDPSGGMPLPASSSSGAAGSGAGGSGAARSPRRATPAAPPPPAAPAPSVQIVGEGYARECEYSEAALALLEQLVDKGAAPRFWSPDLDLAQSRHRRFLCDLQRALDGPASWQPPVEVLEIGVDNPEWADHRMFKPSW